MAANTTQKWLLVAVVLAVATAGVAGAAAAGVGAASSDATTQQECGFPFEGEDATGATVTIEEEPERIVSAAPSAAQTLEAIGAWDRVVGVSAFASYMDGFEEREVVSAEGEPGLNTEKIVGLEPDLVVVPQGFLVEDAETLRDAGVTVYVFEEAESVENVKDQTRLMGELVGECEGAEETVDWMNEELETVERAVDGEQPVRALYVYSYETGPWTAGADTFIGDAMRLAGAENVAEEAEIEGHRRINDEVVADEEIEWLVVNDREGEPPEGAPYQGTTAVEEGNVVVVDSNHLNQPGPRIVYAIQAMVEAFHPGAYAAAQETATATQTPGPDETPTSTSVQTPSPTEDEGVPGFGVPAALVALALALSGLVRHRQ